MHTASTMQTAPRDALADSRQPLLRSGVRPARPSLLGIDALSTRQSRIDERMRTLSLVILSMAVLALGAYWLRTILVRFVLALALYYLLMPLIDVLSCARVDQLRFKTPRALAIILALVMAAGGLALLGSVVIRSIRSFASHEDQYHVRVEQLLTRALNTTSQLGLGGLLPLSTNATEMQHLLADVARHHLSLSALIVELLGKGAAVLENLIYILLFLAFLLAGSAPHDPDAPLSTRLKAEEQVYRYIRGKVAVGLLVAVLDALLLWALRVSLWLVFGVLAFWLSLVPNVGMAISVCLPMPVVLLDPSFSTARAALAFLGPLAVGLVAKDVVEPLLIGHSTKLTPVAVLLSVMLWGSIWGVTGLVLAVPLTAVARIHLEGLDHPLPQYCAAMLSGQHIDEMPTDDEADEEQSKPQPPSI